MKFLNICLYYSSRHIQKQAGSPLKQQCKCRQEIPLTCYQQSSNTIQSKKGVHIL
uniref:Uncharacterized protein n=1 Tax=Arundo donax TaxID=35708 RepID=A0A0A9GPH7_ARUDO